MIKLTRYTPHIAPRDCDTLCIVYQTIASLKEALGDRVSDKVFTQLIRTKQVTESETAIACVFCEHDDAVVPYYLVQPGGTTPAYYRDTMAEFARLMHKQEQTRINMVVLDIGQVEDHPLTHAIGEGLHLGLYAFHTFKKTFDHDRHWLYAIDGHQTSALKEGFIVATAQNYARDLANTPSNKLKPADVVSFVRSMFRSTRVKITCLSKDDLVAEKMGALLAVAQGSVAEPYLIELTLNASKEPPIALVGKGVTFDSGGISIKPSKGMSAMKGDMGGAAAVIGAMWGLAQSATTHHVKAYIPLVENMPSAVAYKPGDVVIAKDGTSIEIINTDAEGRLILADAITYAKQANPAVIVDIATLTGACSVALGDVASGLMGNNQKILDQFLHNQEAVGEKVWQLPIYPEYKAYLQSEVADILNCAENRLAGSSTAAVFLHHFVGDTPWAHIDIASTMENKATKGARIKGMEGVGAKTLIAFVLRYQHDQ